MISVCVTYTNPPGQNIYSVSLNGFRVEQKGRGRDGFGETFLSAVSHWRLCLLSLVILDQHLGYRYPTSAVAPDNQKIYILTLHKS